MLWVVWRMVCPKESELIAGYCRYSLGFDLKFPLDFRFFRLIQDLHLPFLHHLRSFLSSVEINLSHCRLVFGLMSLSRHLEFCPLCYPSILVFSSSLSLVNQVEMLKGWSHWHPRYPYRSCLLILRLDYLTHLPSAKPVCLVYCHYYHFQLAVFNSVRCCYLR